MRGLIVLLLLTGCGTDLLTHSEPESGTAFYPEGSLARIGPLVARCAVQSHSYPIAPTEGTFAVEVELCSPPEGVREVFFVELAFLHGRPERTDLLPGPERDERERTWTSRGGGRITDMAAETQAPAAVRIQVIVDGHLWKQTIPVEFRPETGPPWSKR